MHRCLYNTVRPVTSCIGGIEAFVGQLSPHRHSLLQIECQPAGNIVVSIDISSPPVNLTLHLLQLAGSAGLTSVLIQTDYQVSPRELLRCSL